MADVYDEMIQDAVRNGGAAVNSLSVGRKAARVAKQRVRSDEALESLKTRQIESQTQTVEAEEAMEIAESKEALSRRIRSLIKERGVARKEAAATEDSYDKQALYELADALKDEIDALRSQLKSMS